MEPADQVYMDSPNNAGVTYKSKMPASPTKKVETQRTVTPDGTVITTVTTTTARPKQMSDRKAAMNSEYFALSIWSGESGFRVGFSGQNSNDHSSYKF